MLRLLQDNLSHCTKHLFNYMLLDLSSSVFSPLHSCTTINIDFFSFFYVKTSFHAC